MNKWKFGNKNKEHNNRKSNNQINKFVFFGYL